MRFAYDSMGDKIDAFASRLERVASGGVSSAMHGSMAEAAQALLDQDYATGMSPSGDVWKPRKSGGSWPILVKTRAMSGGTRAVAVPGGCELQVPSPGIFHQNGTKHMAARPILPGQSSVRFTAPVYAAAARKLRDALEARS